MNDGRRYSSEAAVTDRVDPEHVLAEFICRLKIAPLSESSRAFIRVSRYQNLETSLIPIKMKVQ